MSCHVQHPARVVASRLPSWFATDIDKPPGSVEGAQVRMKTVVISLPTMYGDHHVIEVRRLLAELPGITEILASSCFQSVELIYDPAVIEEQAIRARLQDAGYGEELTFPAERPDGVADRTVGTFRHSAAYEHVGSSIAFAQNVSFSGRALWPCPGLGVIREGDVDE